jgi:hypothetical protein
MNVHEFEVHGGMTTPGGKPTWPNMLRLRLTRRQAAEIIRDLAHQISKDHLHVGLDLVGKLAKSKEEV